MEFLLKIFVMLNNLIPKKSNKILFKSTPDFVGNSLALFEYISKNHERYELLWLTNEKVNQNYNKKRYYKNSLRAMYEYVTSKYIITTHGDVCRIKSKHQNYINLWHGMPLKKIGYLGKEVRFMESKSYNRSSYRIATSELTRSLIAGSFNEKANNIKITGQPRNDYLYNNFELSKIGIKEDEGFDKIIFYVPTFRESSQDIINSNFFRFPTYNHKKFLEYLKENNILFLLKLHPYEEGILKDIVENKNFKVIKSKLLSSKDIDINQILSKVDLLISDYSSVYIDYLNLNRPIFFVVPDLEEYREERDGFTLEPFEEWIPGEKIIRFEELISKLNDFIEGADEYKEKRRVINAMLNKFSDNKNSERTFFEFIKD